MKLLTNGCKITLIILSAAILSFLVYNAWPTFGLLAMFAPIIGIVFINLAFLTTSLDDKLNEGSYYEKPD